MTLQQLKYAVLIAETGTFGEAARKLYISQPTLSFAIKELEEEFNIKIFTRSNKGIAVTDEGEEFLRSAKRIILELELFEERFAEMPTKRQRLSVSTQHYTFVSSAFVELMNACKDAEYDLVLNETKTMDVIDAVKSLRSELGVIYIGDDNEAIINKLLNDNNLTFTELFATHPYILVGGKNPLSRLERVSVGELTEYPCVSFVQNDLAPTFFSEEVVSILGRKRSVTISDRGALVDLLTGTDAYVVSTGVHSFTGKPGKIVAIPLDANAAAMTFRVGIIRHRDRVRSSVGDLFCDILKQIVRNFALQEHKKRYF